MFSANESTPDNFTIGHFGLAVQLLERCMAPSRYLLMSATSRSYSPQRPRSNWLSDCVGVAGCLLICCGSSLQPLSLETVQVFRLHQTPSSLVFVTPWVNSYQKYLCQGRFANNSSKLCFSPFLKVDLAIFCSDRASLHTYISVTDII